MTPAVIDTPILWQSCKRAQSIDLAHVKEMLGHRSILGTIVYTCMHDLMAGHEVQDCISRVTRSVEGARRLVEAGFDYVTESKDGLKLFRKPKY